jgi:hypothetical protein
MIFSMRYEDLIIDIKQRIKDNIFRTPKTKTRSEKLACKHLTGDKLLV